MVRLVEGLLPLTAAGVAFSLYGCGGGSSTTNSTTTAPGPAPPAPGPAPPGPSPSSTDAPTTTTWSTSTSTAPPPPPPIPATSDACRRLEDEGFDCGYCLHSLPEDKHDIPNRTALDDFNAEKHALFGRTEPRDEWSENAFLFNTDEVREIELGLSDANWQDMLATPFRAEWHNGTVKFMDKTWPLVQIRFKGSSSVTECLTNQVRGSSSEQRCFKMSFKLKFPHGDHFYGLKAVSLFASAFDQAAVIDRFSNSLFREVGLPAIRQNHAEVKLSIDGGPARIMGLHYLSDDVDTDFTKTYYNGGHGSVYKYVWPGDDERHIAKGQKEGEENATLMLNFGAELYAAKDDYDLVQVLKKYTYVDQWAKFWAVDRAIAHWDGPTTFWVYENGAWTHNSQLYQDDPEVSDEEKFHIIPWDMRMTFMALDEESVVYSIVEADGWERKMYSKGISATQADGYMEWDAPVCDNPQGCIQCAETLSQWDWMQLHPSCTRITRAMARGLRKEFHEGARQLLAGPFQTKRAQMKLDRWHDQIKEYIQKDKEAGVYPGFETGSHSLDPDWDKWFAHFRDVTLPHYIQNLRNHVSCDRGYDPNKWTDELFDYDFLSGVRDPNVAKYDKYPLPSTWPTYNDAKTVLV